MPYDKKLAERVDPLMVRRLGCTSKQMFGGMGYLLYGNMCVGVWKEFLIVRVGPQQYAETLDHPHTREFDITGRPMKGWAMIDPEGLTRPEDLAAWVDRAVRFVETLPAKDGA